MSSFLQKLLLPPKKISGDKALPPEETVKIAEQKLLSSGFKIYKGVKRIDKGRLGIPVFLSMYDIDGQKITGKYKQMGKGVTEEFAKASALMEIVERFSLFSFYLNVPETAIFSTFESLQDKAMDFEVFLSYVEGEKEDRKAIDREIKQIETDGIKHISMAEAMIGLGKFDKAIESAKEALKHKNSFLKAAILITTALRLEGKFKEAIDFLMGILNDRELTEEQQANLKQALGEVYEAMGKKERALIWYREAYRILKDPDLKEKINKLEKEKVS